MHHSILKSPAGFLFFICSLFFFSPLDAQLQFQKAFGGTGDEYGYTTEQLSDGGFIMCGRTISYGVGGFDNYLVRFDANGDTLWTKTYGNVGYDEAQSIRATPDGGFVMVGQTDNVNFAGDVYLVKVDANGLVSWSTAIGGSGTADFGYSLRLTSDNGYIVAGLSASTGAGGRDMLLAKFTSSGALEWSKTYGGSSGDEARSVEQTADGGYIVCGFTQSYGSGYQMYVVKTDADGEVVYSKNLGGSGMELGYSIKQTADGGYILAGYSDSYGAGGVDMLLVKLSSDLSVSWSRTYGGSGDDYGLSLVKTNNGGYAIAGRTASFGGGDADFYLVRTDGTGTHLWSKTYGGSALEQAGNLIQTSDGGFLLTGFTLSFGAGIRDAFLVKTDSNGSSGCNEFSAATQTNSPNVASGTGVSAANGAGSVNPVTAKRNTLTELDEQCSSGVCGVSASFVSAATNVCVGESVSFTNSSSGANSYEWTVDNVLFASTPNASYTFEESGDFEITLMGDDGDCQNSFSVMIEVHALPQVSLLGNETEACLSDDPLTLVASPTGGVWSGPGIVGNSFDPEVAGEGTSTLLYSYTDANQCSGSGSIELTVDACAGISGVVESPVSLYPNPATDYLQVNCSSSVDVRAIALTDVQGRILKEWRVYGPSAFTIDLSNFDAGVYLLRIQGRQDYTRKVIRE